MAGTPDVGLAAIRHRADDGASDERKWVKFNATHPSKFLARPTAVLRQCFDYR